MIKQSDTLPNAVCVLTFCFAPLVATATGATSDDSRVNVAGYLFDHVYTSINGVVTIPFNSRDWSIDSHTIWSFRNSTGSEKENDWEYVIFRRPGFRGESLKEDHVTVGVYVTMKRDKNLREEIEQFKGIYESNLHFKVDKEQRSGLRPGVVEVITLIKALPRVHRILSPATCVRLLKRRALRWSFDVSVCPSLSCLPPPVAGGRACSGARSVMS